MKNCEFICVEAPASPITEQEYAAFYLQFQKSILASLKKRELLNNLQYDCCIIELEKRYGKIIT